LKFIPNLRQSLKFFTRKESKVKTKRKTVKLFRFTRNGDETVNTAMIGTQRGVEFWLSRIEGANFGKHRFADTFRKDRGKRGDVCIGPGQKPSSARRSMGKKGSVKTAHLRNRQKEVRGEYGGPGTCIQKSGDNNTPR